MGRAKALTWDDVLYLFHVVEELTTHVPAGDGVDDWRKCFADDENLG